MGADASIYVYDEEAVRAAFNELWSDLGYSLEKDWWYPSWSSDENKVRIQLGGRWYLIDYADNQGDHEGTDNSFWFTDIEQYVDYPEKWPNGAQRRGPDPAIWERQWREIDERLGDSVPRRCGPKNRNPLGIQTANPAQARVLAALKKAGSAGSAEVWT